MYIYICIYVYIYIYIYIYEGEREITHRLRTPCVYSGSTFRGKRSSSTARCSCRALRAFVFLTPFQGEVIDR